MLLYNWKKIKKESNGNVKDILTILHILTYKLPPVNRHDRIYKFWQKSFHGHSFLVNPEPLFIQRRRYSDSEIAQYAGIASLRNYYEYQNTKDTTLDLFLFTGNQDIIESNRLLWIEGDSIHFKFEEITKGEMKWQ
jgi:hypothetical protein